VSEAHIDCDGDGRADHQDLQHEIVKRSEEELAEGSALWRRLEIGSERIISRVEGGRVDADFRVDSEFLAESIEA